ncbi:MAG: SH3 domain-containing protein [Aristaeellaceae bacterium]
MKKRNAVQKWICAILAVALLVACAPAALATSYSAKINSSACKVYKSASTSSKVLCSDVKDLSVSITGYSGDWAKIEYKGYTGYVKCEYLTLRNRLTAYTAKSTPVYKRASSSSSKLGTLGIGSTVYVVGMDDGYYRIQNRSGSVTGYIKSGYLTATKPKTSSPSDTSSGSSGSTTGVDRAISVAKSLLGRPYAVSDNPPSSFNCSSFVEYCLEKAGFSVKGTAAAQAADSSLAKITSSSSLKKGDILCFDTDGDGTCDHTALYLGSGSFIEASQNAGKVQTNSLSSWYKSHFMWARRPS